MKNLLLSVFALVTVLCLIAGIVTAQTIPIATGSGVTVLPDPDMRDGHVFTITDYGAISGGSALTNRLAIDSAITLCAAAGGGTVIIPDGDFKSFTIHLQSNVGLHFNSKNSIIRAAVNGTGTGKDGGNYDAPEVNLFVGLQDEGHSHWANSLITGVGLSNIMISGPGLIDGSYMNGSVAVNVLSGNDAGEVSTRTAAGSPGIANKAFGLKNDTNIIFRDFSIKNGGHFAILGSGVVNWTVDGIIVDGNRDAFDIDCCQNLTVRNSVFNSLTDDAIVMKASFGLGVYMPCQNILIQNDTVSGYDAGSVLDRVYSAQKMVASDADGPTARIKFGTEGTCGLNTVTVQNCTFDRSRGFCLESVDGANCSDITMTDCTMKNVSSSPIFIRLGDRGRAPVTGIHTTESVSQSNDVRLDDAGFILPNLPKYGSWPATRYIPSYSKNTNAPIGGGNTANGGSLNVSIVNQTAPTRLNANSIQPTNPLYANAVGPDFAVVKNINISNVTIQNADPRYPILIQGLVGHPIQNVNISNITVEYRGYLKMEDAVEQRQLNQNWTYVAYQSNSASQSLPWLANTFFSKNEGLLPRISWDSTANSGVGGWTDDPYNIPEMPREYPEPSILGVVPAYGIYARHVSGLTVNNVALHFIAADERPAVVLDDVDQASFTSFTADINPGVPVFVKVTNTKKRLPDCEYVLNQPYTTTSVTNLSVPVGLAVQEDTVNRPAPGTPSDTYYNYPTAPSTAHPYSFTVANNVYPKPASVYPYLSGFVLPVELASFTATVNRLNAQLSWTTATEVNNYGFDIEKRAVSDKQSAANSWAKVGFVKGNGTSNVQHTYSFSENVTESGTYAYRLKQIDNSGAFKYSQEAQVTIGVVPKVFALNQNYPNPFNPTTTISFTLAQDGITVLRIFDILGREVATLANDMMKAGVLQQVTFDASRFSSGVYFSCLENNGLRQIKKIMLMK
jgi:polygalacturonase